MKQEILKIIKQGENERMEFKESFDSKNLSKEIAAFANASGGKIFLGISDNGKIKGINITNKLKSQIQDIANNCDPSIVIDLTEFENILIINVEEGKDKPYKCSQGFYIRQGANSQKMSRDEILDFAIGEGKIKFDSQINQKFDFKKDFDEEKFLEFLREINISKVISVKEILINLSLGIIRNKKFRLNNAGILLFAKEPNKFFRQNFITCVLYKGKEKVDIIDRKDFNNDLLNNYEDTFAFLKQHLRLEYEIKGFGPRKEIPEIPYEALKEAIINAIVHRDYFEYRFGVFVEIFDDRVEITNYGKLLFDRKKLGKISMPRNSILFDMFHRIHLIEKAGSGINRIKKQIKQRSLRVKFETDEFFRIIFYRPKIKTGLVEGLAEGLAESQKKILIFISKNPKIAKQELAKKIRISTTAIDKNILQLKQKGLLKRIGPDKGGHWETIG